VIEKVRWIVTPFNVVVTILTLITSWIAIDYSVESSYPKIDISSGGIRTPFELSISDPGYLCLYDVKPVCANVNLPRVNLPGISNLYIIWPSLGRICLGEQPLRTSCRIKSPPAAAGSTVILELHYSLHPLWIIRLARDSSLPCDLNEKGTWSCGKPM
jgi:hypothetical protein